jgi:ribosomal protein S18 acetylase RimI-like enzyme
MKNIELSFGIRNLNQEDFFWLKSFDCSPLNIERDSIYLFFCVHFSSTSFVVINKDSNTPVGFLLGFIPQGSVTAYIHYLFVIESYRNKGIGKTLLKHFSEVVSKLGAGEITLFTSKAISFYKKQGFEERNSIFTDTVARYLESHKSVRVMKINTHG